MTMIINPGSGPVTGGTVKQAMRNARDWFDAMREQGIVGVEFNEQPVAESEGRWTFVFTHKLTRVAVELEVHGLTEEERRQLVFSPRIYWRGSSSATPELSDFLASGFRIAIEPDPVQT